MGEDVLGLLQEFQEQKVDFDECCTTHAVSVDYLRVHAELVERLNRKLTEDFFFHVGAKELVNPLMRESELMDYFKSTLPLFNSVSTYYRYKYKYE